VGGDLSIVPVNAEFQSGSANFNRGSVILILAEISPYGENSTGLQGLGA